ECRGHADRARRLHPDARALHAREASAGHLDQLDARADRRSWLARPQRLVTDRHRRTGRRRRLPEPDLGAVGPGRPRVLGEPPERRDLRLTALRGGRAMIARVTAATLV